MKSRVRWTAAVENGLVGRVFAVQKTVEGKTLGQQRDDLLEECAKFLAQRIRVVMQLRCQGPISAVAEIGASLPVVLPLQDNRLLQKAYEYIVDPDFPEKKERWTMSSAQRKGVGKVPMKDFPEINQPKRSCLPRSSD